MGTRLGRALNLEGGRPDFDRSSTTGTMVNSEDRQGELSYLFFPLSTKEAGGEIRNDKAP